MAAREHRVSRRVLLGAACAFPFVPPALSLAKDYPELDSGSSFPPAQEDRWIPGRARNDEKPVLSRVEGWNRALTRFRRAEVTLEAAAHEPDEERYGDLVVAFNRALRRLIRTPAPNLPALSTKIDLAVRESAWELTDGEACMAALVRDARRFGPHDAPSRLDDDVAIGICCPAPTFPSNTTFA